MPRAIVSPAASFEAPQPGPIRGAPALEIVRTEAAFTELQQEWDELCSASEPRNAFLSYAWTAACWAIRQVPAELFILTARDAGRLVAVVPLCIEHRGPFRVARFIADDRSDYLGFLCAGGDPKLEQLLLGALAESRGQWDLLLLKQLTKSYTSLGVSSLPALLRWHRAQWTTAPFLAADGDDWEAFHKSGPSWLREMRKRSRRFVRDGCEAKRFTGAEAIERLGDVSEVEAQSWKGRQGTARLQAGAGRELLRRAFDKLGCGSEMQLWLAFLDQRPVAFQIDIVLPDRIWHYQCAYIGEFDRTRAGSVLAYLSLEHGWRRGIREFDYLSGEEPYKLQRTNGSRAIHHLAGHPPTARGRLAYSMLTALRWRLRNVRALKSMYKAAQSCTRRLRSAFVK